MDTERLDKLYEKQSKSSVVQPSAIVSTQSVSLESEENVDAEQPREPVPSQPEPEEVSETRDIAEDEAIETKVQVKTEAIETVMGVETALPEEEAEYAAQSISMLQEMIMTAVEEQDYGRTVKGMREYAKVYPDLGVAVGVEGDQNDDDFHTVVGLFLTVAASLEPGDYRSCRDHLQRLINLSVSGHEVAQKCSHLAVRTVLDHIGSLRDGVVDMTGQLHEVDDPDDFDHLLEQLRRERVKVEQSNKFVLETCMRGSDERGQSETVLSCLSYGFKIGRLSR